MMIKILILALCTTQLWAFRCIVCQKQATQTLQIAKPTPCESLRRDKQRTCTGHVYAPNLLGHKLGATTCEITQVAYETYVAFFGAKQITKRTPLHSYMGIERCRQVIQTKHDDIAGRLKNMGGGAFATQNSELNLKYTWLTKRTDTITNVVLRANQNIFYNYKQNHLYSHHTDLTRCDPKLGACITPDVTAIWNKNEIDICKIAKKKTLTTTNIMLYRDTRNDKYHLTIPSLAMSFKNFIQDDEIAKCFGNNINVTTDGFVVEFINCEQENNHTYFTPIRVTPSMQRQNPGGSWERFLKKNRSQFCKDH